MNETSSTRKENIKSDNNQEIQIEKGGNLPVKNREENNVPLFVKNKEAEQSPYNSIVFVKNKEQNPYNSFVFVKKHVLEEVYPAVLLFYQGDTVEIMK